MAISVQKDSETKERIEQFTDRDLLSIARIYSQAFSNSPYNDDVTAPNHAIAMVRQAQSHPDYIGLAYRDDENADISGFIWGSRVPRHKALLLGMEGPMEASVSYVSAIAVDIRYRSLGIGRRLIREYIWEARNLHAEHVALSVNELAQANEFYRKLGFRPIKRANGELIRHPERKRNIHLILDIYKFLEI